LQYTEESSIAAVYSLKDFSKRRLLLPAVILVKENCNEDFILQFFWLQELIEVELAAISFVFRLNHKMELLREGFNSF
jgi:hypothetical protein